MPSYDDKLFIASKTRVQDPATRDSLLEVERWLNSKFPIQVQASGLVPAQPFTSQILPASVYGGTMTVMEENRFGDVLWGMSSPGDAYPRMIATADAGLYFGDGTYDPYSASQSAFIIQNQGTYGGLIIAATDVLQLSSSTLIWMNNAELQMGTTSVGKNIKFLHSPSGPVIKSPGGTYYRIDVDNAGNLSTTAV